MSLALLTDREICGVRGLFWESVPVGPWSRCSRNQGSGQERARGLGATGPRLRVTRLQARCTPSPRAGGSHYKSAQGPPRGCGCLSGLSPCSIPQKTSRNPPHWHVVSHLTQGEQHPPAFAQHPFRLDPPGLCRACWLWPRWAGGQAQHCCGGSRDD